jgi:N-acetylneuraminic acid mutarotase
MKAGLNVFIIAILGLLILGVTTLPAAADSGEEFTWSRIPEASPFGPRSAQSSVVFQDRIWIIGGIASNGTMFNDVWSSGDGISWTRVTANSAFSRRSGHRSVVFADKIWVIGGRDGSTKRPLNDVWFSPDGRSWTRATPSAGFTPRWDFAATVHDGKMWIIGGSQDGIISNDVWYSTDGISWINATSDAEFSPRMNPAAASFDGRLFLIGGFDWKTDYNDVWCSDNGITWTRLSGQAPFGERRYHTLETDSSSLYVIGGVKDYPLTYYRDIWKTEDGKNWEQVKPATTYPEGYSQSTVLIDERIFIIGGLNGGSEIWVLPIGTGMSRETYNLQSPLLVKKEISPLSIKQGMTTKISITLSNTGSSTLHDIEVLDEISPHFPLEDGSNHYTFERLEPGEFRIMTYSVRAGTDGSYILPMASVMYAWPDGNYRVIRSDQPRINVIAPLVPGPMPAATGHSLVDQITSGLDAFFTWMFT